MDSRPYLSQMETGGLCGKLFPRIQKDERIQVKFSIFRLTELLKGKSTEYLRLA